MGAVKKIIGKTVGVVQDVVGGLMPKPAMPAAPAPAPIPAAPKPAPAAPADKKPAPAPAPAPEPSRPAPSPISSDEEKRRRALLAMNSDEQRGILTSPSGVSGSANVGRKALLGL